MGLRTGPVDPVLRVEAPLLVASERFGAAKDDPYVAFEDVFYDTQLASASMRQYLPLLEPCLGKGLVLDLGVGRGEFLRLLLGAGLEAQGCEINAAEQERAELRRVGCHARGRAQLSGCLKMGVRLQSPRCKLWSTSSRTTC